MNESMTATMAAHKANISQVDSCLRCQRFACSTLCPSVCVRLYASVCVCVCLCARVSVSMLHIFICGAWIIDKIKTQMASERAPKAAIRSRQWLTNIHTHTNTPNTHTRTVARSQTTMNKKKATSILDSQLIKTHTHTEAQVVFVQDTGHCLCGALSSRAQRSAATASATAMQLPQNVFHCQLGWVLRMSLHSRGRRTGRQLLPIKAAFLGHATHMANPRLASP